MPQTTGARAGLMLEYCCLTREFNQNDVTMQDYFEVSDKSSSEDILRGTEAQRGEV